MIFPKYTCLHIISIAYRYKLIEIPESAKIIPIGEKRKRGRPKKTKAALFYQDDVGKNVEPDDQDVQDSDEENVESIQEELQSQPLEQIQAQDPIQEQPKRKPGRPAKKIKKN